MQAETRALDAVGMQRFLALQVDAVNAVSTRFYATHGSVYERFGPRGHDACREDLAFHLEFLRPVLEYGLLQPMVDYLYWLGNVLGSRGIPADHVAMSLSWLGEFFAERMGKTDGDAVSGALEAARTQYLEGEKSPGASSALPEPWPEANLFETALLAGRQHDALAVMNRCIDGGNSLVDVELHVIQPSLYGIGEKWQANQVTVAQEHMATAIVQSVMTIGLLRSPPPAMISKRVLLACVEDNYHAIGLRMVSDAFQLAGWEVQYLGASTPTAALIQQVEEWRPDLVALSVSFPQQLRAVRDIIARLDARPGIVRPAVIIGGLAINRFSRLAGMVGADAHRTDAPAAVLYAGQISGG